MMCWMHLYTSVKFYFSRRYVKNKSKLWYRAGFRRGKQSARACVHGWETSFVIYHVQWLPVKCNSWNARFRKLIKCLSSGDTHSLLITGRLIVGAESGPRGGKTFQMLHGKKEKKTTFFFLAYCRRPSPEEHFQTNDYADSLPLP